MKPPDLAASGPGDHLRRMSALAAVPSRPGGPCTDINPYYGITSTPVIDPETSTVYVMSYSVEGATIDTTQYR